MAKKAKIQTMMIKNAELAGYVHLEKADTKFVPEGVYHFTALLRGEDAKVAKATIDKAMKENLKKQEGSRLATPPYKVNKDAKTLEIKCKLKAKITLRDGTTIDRKVELYDAKTDPIIKKIGIAAGSIVNCAAQIYCWSTASAGCGVTIQPTAVQVVELVSYFVDKEDAGSIFDTVDGGFDVADAPEASGDEDDPNDLCAADGQPEPVEDDDDDDDDIDF